MAKIGRNGRCGCGSGVKAKRCCGVTRGPSKDSLAVAFLMGAARDVAALAGGRGGGKPHMAQAGIPNADKLDDAIRGAPGIIKPLLKSA